MNITNTIRAIRERKGLTQEDLAERLNITRSNYAYLENRGQKLTFEQLQKIANALGVEVKELLFGQMEEKKNDPQVLQNRIEELENTIKDKNKIINSLEEKVSLVEDTLNDYWDYIITEIAHKLNFKIFDYQTDKGLVKLSIKEYLELPTAIRKEVFLANEDINFSDEEMNILYLELVQSDSYVRATMLMDSLGFENEQLSKMIKRYGNDDFTKTSKMIRDFRY